MSYVTLVKKVPHGLNAVCDRQYLHEHLLYEITKSMQSVYKFLNFPNILKKKGFWHPQRTQPPQMKFWTNL